MDWRDVDTTHCGIAATTAIVGDRWSQLILREIWFGVRRYSDIQRHLQVSPSILANRLRKLVDSGILSTTEYRSTGERSRREYRLTERGRDLALVQIALAEFGYRHLVDDDDRLVGLFDKNTGQPIHLELIDPDGKPVSREDVETRVNPGAVRPKSEGAA